MSVYEWMVALILMAALILKGNKRGSKQFVAVAFVFLFCVMGLRDVGRIGVDSVGSYPHAFRRAGEAGWGALTGKGEAQYNLGFSFVFKVSLFPSQAKCHNLGSGLKFKSMCRIRITGSPICTLPFLSRETRVER